MVKQILKGSSNRMSNLIFQQQGSSPTQAGAGYSQLYAKTDGIVYQQVGTSTEVPIMSGTEVGLSMSEITSDSSLSGSKVCAKVWCSASTADTPVVHSSYNVSSVTNPSGSLQQVNFATALANNDYAVVTSCSRSSTRNGDIGVEYFNESTTSVQLQGGNSGNPLDLDSISVAIFGE